MGNAVIETGAAAGPCPGDQTLLIDIPCYTDRRGRPNRHSIAIHSDWTVETGHDLEAERVGTAFGGHLSCLDLVDMTMPAFRDAMQLWSRSALPSLRRGSRGWVLEAGCECRHATIFRDPGSAAAHARSVEHVARLYRCDTEQLRCLLEASSAAYGDLNAAPRHPAARVVREPWGLAELWDAGVSPERVADLHRTLWPDDDALPIRFYLHVALLRPTTEYLVSVIDATRDPDTATWAAMTERPLDRRSPQARALWLKAGTGRRDVEELIESGYTVDDAHDLAARTGGRVGVAAQLLAAWCRAGCSPRTSDLVELHEAGDTGWSIPTKPAIDRLMTLCLEHGVHPTRTQAGLVLAVAGTVPTGFELMRAGARDVQQAAELHHRGERHGVAYPGAVRISASP